MVEMRRPAGADYEVQVRVRPGRRLDGMSDLRERARGRSVLDVGCNRGLVALDLAWAGAKLVHGIDNYDIGIATARENLADLAGCEARFEVGDLTEGPKALAPFGGRSYDLVLLLATYHKLKREMAPADLSALVLRLGQLTGRWFAWRGTSDKPDENDAEMAALDRDLGLAGLSRIHTSYLSDDLGVCAIWARR